MTTAEIIATVIAGWFLVSFLFGLAAGRLLQIYRARCPRFWEVFNDSGDGGASEGPEFTAGDSSSQRRGGPAGEAPLSREGLVASPPLPLALEQAMTVIWSDFRASRPQGYPAGGDNTKKDVVGNQRRIV